MNHDLLFTFRGAACLDDVERVGFAFVAVRDGGTSLHEGHGVAIQFIARAGAARRAQVNVSGKQNINHGRQASDRAPRLAD